MAVATSTVGGHTVRTHGAAQAVRRKGFVFYTNYDSRKGGELQANPRAALLFYWDPLGRQIRIEGQTERTSAQDSASYARSRPRGGEDERTRYT